MGDLTDTTTAKRLTEALIGRKLKLVLAESCTSGLAAAMLGAVPGVSNHFCGSAVTYRIDTKSQWLGIDTDFIDAHTGESPETSLAMAIGVLDRTPEAHLSAAITGHLGPGAPLEKDGVVHVAVAKRDGLRRSTKWESFTLEGKLRADRQKEAAQVMLKYISGVLSDGELFD